MKNDGLLTESSSNNVHSMDVWNSLTGKRGNLVDLLDPYLSGFSVWKCPFLDSAADIDDPNNTYPGYLRSTYQYWANLNGIGGKIIDKRLSKQSPMNALLTDAAYQWNGNWRTGHDDGSGTLHQFWTNMPSLKLYINGGIESINQVYADSSAKKTRQVKMVYRWGGSDCFAAEDSQYD